MIVREKSRQMLYVGADLSGKAGIIRKTIGELSQNELRAWYKSSPQDVGQHVIFTPEKKSYEPTIKENTGSPEQEQSSK
jgi:hypothetical protein